MQLMTKGLAQKLPELYDTEEVAPEDKMVVAKFFHPGVNWTWYVIEYDGKNICWGLVDGLELEFGYFSMQELNDLVGPFGLRVERDIFFRPTRVKDLAVYGKGGVVY